MNQQGSDGKLNTKGGGQTEAIQVHENKISYNNYHTNFKLKQTKNNPDHVVFSDPYGYIIDDFEMLKTQLNHSMGRSPNGSETWGIFGHPTLGNENSETSYIAYATAPVMNLEAGFHNGTQYLEIYTDEPNAIIRYTTNGTKPFFASTLYSEPLTISETQVVKAIVFSDNPSILPSFITFNTYFIDENHSWYIVFICLPPNSFRLWLHSSNGVQNYNSSI